MVTTLLFTTLFLIIRYYLRDLINYYKTGDPNENNQNYWMFSYDFKDDEDFKKYWDKDIQSLNQRKRMRNKLKSSIHGFVDYKAFSDYYAKNAQKLEEDVNEWGDYVQFLSNGRTKALDFVESVVGDIARSKKANEYNLILINN